MKWLQQHTKHILLQELPLPKCQNVIWNLVCRPLSGHYFAHYKLGVNNEWLLMRLPYNRQLLLWACHFATVGITYKLTRYTVTDLPKAVTKVHKLTYKYQRDHESTQRRIWVSSTHEDFVRYTHEIMKLPFSNCRLEWQIWAPNTIIWACTISYLLSSNLNQINYVRIDALGTVGKPYSSAACSKRSSIIKDDSRGQSPGLRDWDLQRTAYKHELKCTIKNMQKNLDVKKYAQNANNYPSILNYSNKMQKYLWNPNLLKLVA